MQEIRSNYNKMRDNAQINYKSHSLDKETDQWKNECTGQPTFIQPKDSITRKMYHQQTVERIERTNQPTFINWRIPSLERHITEVQLAHSWMDRSTDIHLAEGFLPEKDWSILLNRQTNLPPIDELTLIQAKNGQTNRRISSDRLVNRFSSVW